ncbi:MAG: alpha/beta hydrolase [candidate division FCPU426 bacterium]
MKKIIVSISVMLLWITACTHTGLRSNHVAFGDHNIHYLTCGNSDKTLVFIHGWTSNALVWKYQLEAFPGYKVIAIDLPGNGKSSKNMKAEYTMELFADGVARVLKTEKINQAFFLGHSMGFAVAEVIAVRYPDLCAGLASIDGAHFVVPDDPKAREEWLQFNQQMADGMVAEQGREEFLNMLLLPDTPALLKAEMLAGSREVPLTIGKSMIEGVGKDVKYWNQQVANLPCLAIYGPVYQLTPKDKQDFMDQYPRAEYHELQGVSHFFMLERPYQINQIITDYLNQHYPTVR